MTDRRRFLALAGLGLWAARAPGADEPTSLAYAIDVDNFWKSLPILDRLKKVADAGFAHYMFTNYRAKDIAAIDKLGRELNLTPLRFLAFRGIADPKRKDEFLEAIDDATEAATTLGVKSLRIDVGPVVDGVEPEPMRDAVVDALKEAVDKAKEQGITFLIDPPNPRDRPFLGSRAEAVAILDAVGSADLKLLEAIDPAAFKLDLPHSGGFDLAVPSTAGLPGVLKSIRVGGFTDPIGLTLGFKIDPASALKSLREADAAARMSG